MSNRRSKLLALFSSPVGKKVLTGITGLGLTLFVLVHMLGNLSYFSRDAQAYNKYSHLLTHGLGALFYAIELGLLAFFIIHAVIGIRIYLGKQKARSAGYAQYRSAGNPSKQTFSSRTMIITGVILLVFLVIHLMSFKYGPGVAQGYVVTVDGAPIRDLRRLLTEKFHHPLYAFGYPLAMVLLAFHLRHGVWSAFQSLGAVNPRLTPVVYTLGGVLALLIAVGFLVLPLWIFFFVQAPTP